MRSHGIVSLVFLIGACSASNEKGPADGGTSVGIDGSSAEVAPPSPDASVDAVISSACSSGALCNGQTGLCADLPACTSAAPCENALVGVTRRTISEPITIPVCKTASAGKAVFEDGPARTWVDTVTGQTRAACVFKPMGTAANSKRPLLVYLHGSGGSANAVYDSTSLRAKAASFNLSGDPARLGFILVADQGRNLNNSNGNPASAHHEFYLRDLKSPSSSADIRSLDRLIDQVVAEGGVDEKRIYVTGWSNGAFFGQLYSLARHTTATPGGNKVAAAAVFDGANPFVRPTDNDAACDYSVLPKVALPVFLVHRACSIVPCDEAQRAALGGPPGFAVTEWAETLRSKVGAVDVTQLTLNGMGVRVTSCPATALCSEALATINHVRWPDGVADGSGKDWEIDMLDYLRGHPLP